MSRKRAFYLSVALAALAGIVPRAEGLTSQQWAESINAAEFALANQDFATAEQLFDLTKRQSSSQYQHFETSRLLGRFYAKVNDMAKAESELKECQVIGSSNPYFKCIADKELANVYANMGRGTEAQALAKAANENYNRYEGMNLNVELKQLHDEANKIMASQIKASNDTPHLRTLCACLVDRAGTISYLHIAESSGNTDWDVQAIQAAKKLRGFTPRPIGSPEFLQLVIPISSQTVFGY